MPRTRRAVLIVLGVFVAAGAAALWLTHRAQVPADTLTVYGNVDVRQVQLAFNAAGRIQSLAVQEGQRVRQGQVLARLEPSRYQDAVGRARAALQAQREQLAKLRAGTRPQEINQARAALDAARATEANADAVFARQKTLVASGFSPHQSLDNATQALRAAEAQVRSAQQALSLALQGPRREDIDAAAALVRADEAALALAERELADTALTAPQAGVIEDRILEPGDMASPQVPALTLALDDPLWVRAYVPESQLGHVAPGMRAQVFSDSFPGQAFDGWIGFVSPTAEFTPKTVQSPELRTQLVYRVRVLVCHAEGRLRLGMPVTVSVPLRANPAGSAAHGCAA